MKEPNGNLVFSKSVEKQNQQMSEWKHPARVDNVIK